MGESLMPSCRLRQCCTLVPGIPVILSGDGNWKIATIPDYIEGPHHADQGTTHCLPDQAGGCILIRDGFPSTLVISSSENSTPVQQQTRKLQAQLALSWLLIRWHQQHRIGDDGEMTLRAVHYHLDLDILLHLPEHIERDVACGCVKVGFGDCLRSAAPSLAPAFSNASAMTRTAVCVEAVTMSSG